MSDDATSPVDPGSSEEQIKVAVLTDQLAPMPAAATVATNPLDPAAWVSMLPGSLVRQAEAAGADAGHGYEFSPAQVDAAIKKFEDVLEKAQDAGLKLGRAIDDVSAPADDGPSNRQAQATRASLRRAQQHNDALQEFARSFLRKLNGAKASYQDTEHHNTGNAQRQM